MLGNQAHEALQPPSKLEERKRLKEAQHAAHVLSAARPHPPRTRGVISASLEGSPPKPSTAPRASASLEGSKPALEKADRICPKELSSRTPGVTSQKFTELNHASKHFFQIFLLLSSSHS